VTALEPRVSFVRPQDLTPAQLLDEYLARLRRRNYAKTTLSHYSRGLRAFLAAELLRALKDTKLRSRSRKWTWDEQRPVFPGGQYVRSARSNWWLNQMLRRLAQGAGLRYKLTCHTLRHGFFRLLKTRGVPLEVAARLGGHNSIRTTADVYGTLDLDDLQKSYDTLIEGVMNPVIAEVVAGERVRARSMTAPV